MGSPEYHRAYNIRRYHKKFAECIQILGGKCNKCGVARVLQLDHVDPSTKSFDISGKMLVFSWTRILDELRKCQLLCVTCHKEKTIAEQSVEHGGGVSGKRNCKCDLCRTLKNSYMLEYKRRRRQAAKA